LNKSYNVESIIFDTFDTIAAYYVKCPDKEYIVKIEDIPKFVEVKGKPSNMLYMDREFLEKCDISIPKVNVWQYHPTQTIIGYIKVMDWRDGEPRKGTTSCCTICTLTYRDFDGDKYEWEFAPWWDRIMNVSEYWQPVVQNGWIPGLDEDDFDDPDHRKRDTYVFKNVKPPFIYQRTPPKNRPDVMERMYSVGLTKYDAMKYLIRTPFHHDCYIVDGDAEDDYEKYMT